jgi:hypothetical protein
MTSWLLVVTDICAFLDKPCVQKGTSHVTGATIPLDIGMTCGRDLFRRGSRANSKPSLYIISPKSSNGTLLIQLFCWENQDLLFCSLSLLFALTHTHINTSSLYLLLLNFSFSFFSKSYIIIILPSNHISLFLLHSLLNVWKEPSTAE